MKICIIEWKYSSNYNSIGFLFKDKTYMTFLQNDGFCLRESSRGLFVKHSIVEIL